MRGEHELERDALLQQLLRHAVEPREGRRERLRRHAPLVGVLAAAAHPVLLLGDVRELEVDGEGAQDARLAVDRQRRHRRAQLVERRPSARLARERPHPLDVGEERGVLLLDEHPPEQVAEQADIAPQRRVRGSVANRHETRVGNGPRETGQSVATPRVPR